MQWCICVRHRNNLWKWLVGRLHWSAQSISILLLANARSEWALHFTSNCISFMHLFCGNDTLNIILCFIMRCWISTRFGSIRHRIVRMAWQLTCMHLKSRCVCSQNVECNHTYYLIIVCIWRAATVIHSISHTSLIIIVYESCILFVQKMRFQTQFRPAQKSQLFHEIVSAFCRRWEMMFYFSFSLEHEATWRMHKQKTKQKCLNFGKAKRLNTPWKFVWILFKLRRFFFCDWRKTVGQATLILLIIFLQLD